MAEYISRSKAEFELCEGNIPEPYRSFCRRVINDRNLIPAADVAPVRHGWWLHSHYKDCSEHFEIVKCSNCGHEAYAMAFYVRDGNFCPNCGAKMDGDT
jgi:DNA-directed RNA polymerase subunit RPC12/RpoP